MKVACLGGSNTIYSLGYATKLKYRDNGLNVKNYSVPATGIMCGLHLIIKQEIIKENDLIICDFILNDMILECHHILYAPEKTLTFYLHELLENIINSCAFFKKKMLFLQIPFNHLINKGTFELKTMKNRNSLMQSDMYNEVYGKIVPIYNNFLKKNNLTLINILDEIELYLKKTPNCKGCNWWKDEVHISEHAHELLYDSILKEIKNLKIPKFIDKKFEIIKNPSVIKVENYFDFYLNYNRGVEYDALKDLYYIEITDEIIFKFNKKTTILNIELLTDLESPYVVFFNSKTKVVKDAHQDRWLPPKDSSQYLRHLQFPHKKLEDNFVGIKIIEPNNDDLVYLDGDVTRQRDRAARDNKLMRNNNFFYCKKQAKFKLISILLNNDAHVIQCFKTPTYHDNMYEKLNSLMYGYQK